MVAVPQQKKDEMKAKVEEQMAKVRACVRNGGWVGGMRGSAGGWDGKVEGVGGVVWDTGYGSIDRFGRSVDGIGTCCWGETRAMHVQLCLPALASTHLSPPPLSPNATHPYRCWRT